jgi:hypothetical protein|tara:strand:- start:594 stop:842 length:249 start_codon:yes stop_codon:yes gene_type:complete
MPQKLQSEPQRIIYRFVVLLISILIIGYALAAPKPKEPAFDISGKYKSASAGQKRQGTVTAPVFVPSEKVSADKAVSFPTDI